MNYPLAIRQALNELGVPGPDYPASVANAVHILNAAIEAGESEGIDPAKKPFDQDEVDTKRLYGTTNCYVWAEEFAKVFPDVDQGTVATWFANAMMTQLDRSELPKWKPTRMQS